MNTTYNNWYGPYQLNKGSIDTNVTDGASLGNYILSLGTKPNSNELSFDYVGRAHDEPVKDRIKDHLTDDLKCCTHFWVMYKQTAEETFDQECRDYHRYNPKLNKEHPASLPNSTRKCPVCGC